MYSSDGPPARNTRAAARLAREQARESQSIPSREGSQETGDAFARPDYTAPREESLLTSIADSTSDPQQPSEGENLEGYAPSEQETVRNTTEEAIE